MEILGKKGEELQKTQEPLTFINFLEILQSLIFLQKFILQHFILHTFKHHWMPVISRVCSSIYHPCFKVFQFGLYWEENENKCVHILFPSSDGLFEKYLKDFRCPLGLF